LAADFCRWLDQLLPGDKTIDIDQTTDGVITNKLVERIRDLAAVGEQNIPCVSLDVASITTAEGIRKDINAEYIRTLLHTRATRLGISKEQPFGKFTIMLQPRHESEGSFLDPLYWWGNKGPRKVTNKRRERKSLPPVSNSTTAPAAPVESKQTGPASLSKGESDLRNEDGDVSKLRSQRDQLLIFASRMSLTEGGLLTEAGLPLSGNMSKLDGLVTTIQQMLRLTSMRLDPMERAFFAVYLPAPKPFEDKAEELELKVLGGTEWVMRNALVSEQLSDHGPKLREGLLICNWSHVYDVITRRAGVHSILHAEDIDPDGENPQWWQPCEGERYVMCLPVTVFENPVAVVGISGGNKLDRGSVQLRLAVEGQNLTELITMLLRAFAERNELEKGTVLRDTLSNWFEDGFEPKDLKNQSKRTRPVKRRKG